MWSTLLPPPRKLFKIDSIEETIPDEALKKEGLIGLYPPVI